MDNRQILTGYQRGGVCVHISLSYWTSQLTSQQESFEEIQSNLKWLLGIHNKSMCLPVVPPQIPSTECHFILLLHYLFQSSFLLYQQRHHPAHPHHSKHAAAQWCINLKHSIFHKLHCPSLLFVFHWACISHAKKVQTAQTQGISW